FPGFGRMTELDSLKCDGQWPTVRQVLAIAVRILIISLFKVSFLRWYHVIWSSPSAEVLEHFLSSSLKSTLEKGSHLRGASCGVPSRMVLSVGLSDTEL